MNVLFVTKKDSSLLLGGIELITAKIATHLFTFYQYNCSLVYWDDISSELVYKSCWKERYKFQDLIINEEIIKSKKYDAIIVQQVPDAIFYLKQYIYDNGLSTKLIYVQHDCLSINQSLSKKHSLIYRLKRNKFHSLKELMFLILFPFYAYVSEYRLIKNFRPAFDMADQVVILSNRFLSYGKKIIGKKNLSKVVAIENFLTLPVKAPSLIELKNKSKEVLIVSRLCEERKRISIALKIWNIIEKTIGETEWKLIIVGDGEDTRFYKELVEKYQLKRVSFEGKCKNVIPYYKSASLFMMTSDLEGWGLTLTESLQMGVVPFVFNSFESLHDIIIDNLNGCIISNGNIKEYAIRMLEIMNNSDKRYVMAVNGVKSAQQFSVVRIISKWKFLLEEK